MKRMTYAEYVQWERSSEGKHEYVDGEVYAMSGGSPEHSRVAANILGSLNEQLRGRSCQVFTSNMRIRTGDGVGTYPDGSGLCGPRQTSEDASDELVNPSFVLEVLSDGTEAYDRGEKFAHYRTIPTLSEYLLASSKRARLELYTLVGDHWELRVYGPGDRVDLPSLGCRLAVDEVYDKVFGDG